MERDDFLGAARERLLERTPKHPQDDWSPALYIEVNGECIEITTDGLPINPMESQRGKDILASAFADLIRIVNPTQVAFAATAWEKIITDEEKARVAETFEAFVEEHGREPTTYSDMGITAPSDDPDNRREIVVMVWMDGEHNRPFIAEIKRHDNRPARLSEFEDVIAKYEAEGGEAGAYSDGRFVEPLMEALKEAHASG